MAKSVKKIILIFAIALSCLLGAATLSGCYYSERYVGPVYELSEDGEYYSVGWEGSVSHVSIPAEHEGLPVRKIMPRSFTDCTGLQNISLPETITEIGESAFKGCNRLEKFTVGKNVEVIGDSAFSGCNRLFAVYNLSDLDITAGSSENGGVAKYAYGVFTDLNDGFPQEYGFVYYDGGDSVTILDYAQRTSHLVFPDKINGKNYAVADYAFRWKNFDSITFGTGLTEIGEDAFYDCSPDKITFKEGLKKIGKSAFCWAHCSELTIPDSVEEIGDDAFYGSTNLQTLTIGKGVKYIGGSAFQGTLLKTLNYNATDCKFGTSKLTYLYGAFEIRYSCTVNIGKDVEVIPEKVFKKPDSPAPWVTYDGAIALNFENDGALVSIGESAFEGNSFTEISLPDSLEELSSNAFRNCKALTKIHIGKGLKEISGNPFVNCSALSEIEIDGENAAFTVNDGCLIKTDGGVLICGSVEGEIPEGTKIIGAYAFSESAITELVVPEGVAEICEYAFYRNVNLKSVVLPQSLTKLGKNAFYSCPVLEFVDLGGVEEIGADAFTFDYALTRIVMHENLRIIGYDAFAYCDLTELYIPDSVTRIFGGAFRNNQNLTEVSIPSTARWEYKSSFPENCTVTKRTKQD